MEFPILLIIGGAVLCGGLIIAAVIHFDRQRTRDLEDIARDLGLQFEKDATQQTSGVRERFELFSKGRSHNARNLIHGETSNTGVWIFDYRYTVGGGKDSRSCLQSVICFSSAQLDLPRFELYREGMMSRLGSSVFGTQDIDFETHPDFSQKYVLKGDSEEKIRDTFRPEVLTFLESQDRNIRIEGDRDSLLLYRSATRVKPLRIREFLAEGFTLFREFQSKPSTS